MIYKGMAERVMLGNQPLKCSVKNKTFFFLIIVCLGAKTGVAQDLLLTYSGIISGGGSGAYIGCWDGTWFGCM